MRKFAAKESMEMMKMTTNWDDFIGAMLKWTTSFIFLIFFVSTISSFHQQHLQKLKSDSDLINEKSFLVRQLHNEMLLITRTQLGLLHATNETQVKTELSYLTTLISNHLVNYYQFKSITDESDIELLNKFKFNFEKWRNFNEDILGYANAVSDAGFLKTLGMIDLAFSQIDSSPNEAGQIIAQLKQNIEQGQEISN